MQYPDDSYMTLVELRRAVRKADWVFGSVSATDDDNSWIKVTKSSLLETLIDPTALYRATMRGEDLYIG